MVDTSIISRIDDDGDRLDDDGSGEGTDQLVFNVERFPGLGDLHDRWLIINPAVEIHEGIVVFAETAGDIVGCIADAVSVSVRAGIVVPVVAAVCYAIVPGVGCTIECVLGIVVDVVMIEGITI